MSVETSTTYNEAQQAWHCLWCHAPLGENEHCRKPACEARQRTADTRMGRRSPYYGRIKGYLSLLNREQVDPRYVEAYIRLEHSTLDGLSVSAFKKEVKFAIQCIDASTPEDNESCAQSFGL